MRDDISNMTIERSDPERLRSHFHMAVCGPCKEIIVGPTDNEKYCESQAGVHNLIHHGGSDIAQTIGFDHYPGVRDLGLI